MRIGVFGFGIPGGVFSAIGLDPVDVTLERASPEAAVDRYIEPFMDPFAASVLRGMAGRDFDHLAAIIFLRESPGAMIACQYARELRRRGVMPVSAPMPIMLNVIPAAHEAALVFNRAETDRLVSDLHALGWSAAPGVPGRAEAFDRLIADQSAGRISGAEAYLARASMTEWPTPRSAEKRGERFALLGAPLGNAVLHRELDAVGVLALDQQALDQAAAARGDGLEQALRAQAFNPFAARQPKPLYLSAIKTVLLRHQIDRVVWQVGPYDDLWGWLGPQVRGLCEETGIGFTDLGLVPRWLEPGKIAIAGNL